MKLRTLYIMILGAILLVICVIMVASFSDITTLTSREVAIDDLPTIIVDAGHGGEDGGAEVDGVLEKDINLAISKQVADILRLSGCAVKEVRREDISVYSDDAETLHEKKVSDLKNRVAQFNESADNIVVSIHQNKFDSSKYHGTQLFYSENHSDSMNLAKSIHTAVVMLLQSDNTRELKPAGDDIYILDNAEVPAVIVECGFLSNPDERAKLTDKTYQQEIAYAVAMGVIDYCQHQNER